ARPLRTFIDHLDDAADAVADAVTFEARLLLLREPRFGLAEVEHVVGSLDPLDGAVDELARAAGVFVENGLTLGFADFLEDDLLGGLGGDAAEGFGVLRDADFGADFSIGRDTPGFQESHLVSRVFDRLDDFLNGIESDGAGLRVHIGDIVLIGAIVLAGRDQHCVLDRVQHNLRVDALFLAQDFDGLKNRFQGVLVLPSDFSYSGRIYHSCLRLAFCTWSRWNSMILPESVWSVTILPAMPASVPSQLRWFSMGSRSDALILRPWNRS